MPSQPSPQSVRDRALHDLLRQAQADGYDFVTPTPLTEARLRRRSPGRRGHTLRDILGWTLPFKPEEAPPGLVERLTAGGALIRDGDEVRSALRISRLQGRLFFHSAYPTTSRDAVFLGPDSYRFADFLRGELTGRETGLIVDVGGGAGVGAVVAASKAPGADLVLTDVNPLALRLAQVNARHARVALTTLRCDGLAGAPDGPQVVLANPPYIADTDQTYSDGGGARGDGLSRRWAAEALARLRPGGRLLLYTGAAILDGGRDPLRQALAEIAERDAAAAFSYREIDPDVFGEELERPAYAGVERIAAIGCTITRAA